MWWHCMNGSSNLTVEATIVVEPGQSTCFIPIPIQILDFSPAWICCLVIWKREGCLFRHWWLNYWLCGNGGDRIFNSRGSRMWSLNSKGWTHLCSQYGWALHYPSSLSELSSFWTSGLSLLYHLCCIFPFTIVFENLLLFMQNLEAELSQDSTGISDDDISYAFFLVMLSSFYYCSFIHSVSTW